MSNNENEELLLTPEDKERVFENYPCLDPSFEDDYRTEVELLLEAQLAKAKQYYELKFNPDYLDFQEGVKQGRIILWNWLNSECPHQEPPIIRRACDICWYDKFEEIRKLQGEKC